MKAHTLTHARWDFPVVELVPVGIQWHDAIFMDFIGKLSCGT